LAGLRSFYADGRAAQSGRIGRIIPAPARVRPNASLFLPPLALRFAAKEECAAGRAGQRLRIGKTAMGSFSIWHWMLFIAVALLLFGGKGKISDIMGDVAKGVKSFKKGMTDDDEEKPASTVASSAPRTIENRVGVDANDVHKVG
jgi:sec-independent protein translocase protein TatA